MKRTYLQPTLNIITIESNQILLSGSNEIRVSSSTYSEDMTDLVKQDNGWSDIWEDDWSKE